ncbi:MAG: HAD family hydrolase [Candidatus Lokiarchaeota archaeon]|nr:HAD family hydrolase [Candidatus Lokiarchaeota archaeon]
MQGVFFDLFGTLLIYTNSRKAWEDWLSVLYNNLRNCGYKETKESFAIKCNGIMSKSEPNYSNLDLTIFEQRIYGLTNELGLDVKENEIRRISQEAVNAWQKYVPLDPDTVSVLNTLKKTKTLALISNFDHYPHIYSILSEHKLKHFFDSIIISSEVGVKKPDPSIFSFALKQTNLKPNEVCYIGDTRDDVTAAVRAKILPILIQRKVDTEDELLYDYNTEKVLLNTNTLDKEIKDVKVIKSLKELVGYV